MATIIVKNIPDEIYEKLRKGRRDQPLQHQ
jgi:hypothetical protein